MRLRPEQVPSVKTRPIPGWPSCPAAALQHQPQLKKSSSHELMQTFQTEIAFQDTEMLLCLGMPVPQYKSTFRSAWGLLSEVSTLWGCFSSLYLYMYTTLPGTSGL